MKKLVFILGLFFTTHNFAAQGVPDIILQQHNPALPPHQVAHHWPAQNRQQLFFDTVALAFAHRGLPYTFALEWGALAYEALFSNNYIKGVCLLGATVGVLGINHKARKYVKNRPWLQLDDDFNAYLKVLTIVQGFKAFCTINYVVDPTLRERVLESQRQREMYFKMLETHAEEISRLYEQEIEKWAKEATYLNKELLEKFLSLQER